MQEVENSRVGGSSSTSTDMDLSDSLSSAADIISKKLVTFNSIAELQENNMKLLAIVKKLSEPQDEAESCDPSVIAEMKMKLERLRDVQNELLEERERQNKMMMTLSNQRDMYQNLYKQAVRANGGEEAVETSFTSSRVENTNSDGAETMRHETGSSSTTNEIQGQIDGYKKKIAQLESEIETYRKEKSANEKILLEQLEGMRGEVKELVRLNCKLTSQVENSEEKFKVAQNNIEIYKKQITALEKQNRIYNETVVKHEQVITYLKDETMQCQTKLSKAEVMLGNLQKENALLRDAEQRLVKERENSMRETHQQNMIQTNIELIKATLERTDAEGFYLCGAVQHHLFKCWCLFFQVN